MRQTSQIYYPCMQSHCGCIPYKSWSVHYRWKLAQESQGKAQKPYANTFAGMPNQCIPSLQYPCICCYCVQ